MSCREVGIKYTAFLKYDRKNKVCSRLLIIEGSALASDPIVACDRFRLLVRNLGLIVISNTLGLLR